MPDDLTPLTELLDAGTPGEWCTESDGIYHVDRLHMVTPTGDSDQDRADAAKIVAAVNAAPTLIAELAELREVNESLRLWGDDMSEDGLRHRSDWLNPLLEVLPEDFDADCAAEVSEAVVARLREAEAALEACSEFGCDLCAGPGDTCLDRHPDAPNEWCQTCIAQAAIARNYLTQGGTDD